MSEFFEGDHELGLGVRLGKMAEAMKRGFRKG